MATRFATHASLPIVAALLFAGIASATIASAAEKPRVGAVAVAAPAAPAATTTLTPAKAAAVARTATPATVTKPVTRKLLWSDEFHGPAGSAPNTSTWQIQTGGGGWGNNELEAYTARRSNVALNGHGVLNITARHETYTDYAGDVRQYTSARLMSYKQFKYGYLVAQIRIPSGAGLWPAFWTLGADIRHNVQWPATGEIDVMESINDMHFVAGTLHGTNKTAANPWEGYALSHQVTRTSAAASGWHTYGVYWTAARITWYLDGKPFATIAKKDLAPNDVWEFNKPHVALLDLAVGGNWPGSPNAATRFPAVMSVNSVRLYNHP